jgi:hypothetical protein
MMLAAQYLNGGNPFGWRTRLPEMQVVIRRGIGEFPFSYDSLNHAKILPREVLKYAHPSGTA